MNHDAPSANHRYSNEIIILAGILTVFGLLAVYSSSSITAFQRTGDSFFYVRKQAFTSLLGFLSIGLIQIVPFKWIERVTLPLLACAIFLVLMTSIPQFQHKVNGASRWLKFGPLTFQPAEIAKLAIIMFLSKNIARSSIDLKKIPGILSNLLIPGIIAVPLMLQPDFGSTFLIFTMTSCMLFVSGLPTKYIVSGLIVGVAGATAAVIQAPYRMARLTSFLEPWEHLHRGGFQIIQSYLGFQKGGLFGLGIGESKQKLYFLPEAHTDFILAVIGEEFGLFGVLFVITCFGMLLNAGIKVALRQKRTYTRLLAFGFTSLIAIQASFNMGVAMGLLPTKGISLPFVSNGASSLTIFLIMIGLLSRMDRGDLSFNEHQKK